MKRLVERIAKIVVPWLVYCLTLGWFGTCRVKEHGTEHRDGLLYSDNSAIAIFWHYSIVFILFQVRTISVSVMVSASKDGDYLARLAKLLGFKPVRGSRNRGGVAALKQMIKEVAAGNHVGIVADGSQGPCFKVQPGGILIASKTGMPLLPMAWSASRYFTFGSWDRTAIPYPFSKIDFCYGEPVFIPPDLSSEELEIWRQKFEERLVLLYHEAWTLQGKDGH